MKILLICSAGMSTSFLVSEMRKYASPEDIIEAYPFRDLERLVLNYDVILVAPHMRFQYDYIAHICDSANKPVQLLDMISYGRRDGIGMLKQAKQLFNSK